MGTLKRIGAYVLALALATAFVPAAALATPGQAVSQDTPLVAQEATDAQAYGDLLWQIDDTGKLKIWPVNGESGTLSISGNAPWQAQAASITSVELADGIYAGSLGGMFRGCSSLITVDLSNLDTSETFNMSSMFSACSSLLMVDLSSFDTSNLMRMGGMFAGCTSLVAVDLSSFDTSACSDMRGVFSNCNSLVRVKLGDKFRFTSEEGKLPESEWQSATTGETYTSEQIYTDRQGIADTYTNLKPAVEAPVITDEVAVTWTKGSKDGFSLRSDANILLFEGVKIDGTSVDAANYEVTEGSTIVALKPSYLQTLTEGEHTVDIVSITGSASAKFTVAPDPTVKPDTPDVPDNPDKPSNPDYGSQVMYRMYNPNSGEHFYTASVEERNDLMWRGWNAEGAAWTAPSWGTPVFRLYNPNAGEHHYTTSEIERAVLIYAGWNDEGVGWYADTEQRVPVYRVYNPNAFSNNHHYTTDWGERDVLIDMGWRDEGIGWHGIDF